MCTRALSIRVCSSPPAPAKAPTGVAVGVARLLASAAGGHQYGGGYGDLFVAGDDACPPFCGGMSGRVALPNWDGRRSMLTKTWGEDPALIVEACAVGGGQLGRAPRLLLSAWGCRLTGRPTQDVGTSGVNSAGANWLAEISGRQRQFVDDFRGSVLHDETVAAGAATCRPREPCVVQSRWFPLSVIVSLRVGGPISKRHGRFGVPERANMNDVEKG